MRTDPTADQRRNNLVMFLSRRSGFYAAEAVGVLAMKLLCLVIAALFVPALPEIFADGMFSALFLGTVVILAILALTCTALFAWTDLVVDRLRPSHRYHRPRHAQDVAGRGSHGCPDSDPTWAPSRSRRPLTVVLAVLSLPVLLVLAHILSAYIPQLLRGAPIRWMSWEYSGFAVELLFAATNRWPLVALVVLAVSLACLLLLLARSIGAALRHLRASARHRRSTETPPQPLPDLPDRVLRSSSQGQSGTILAAGVFLLLGLPSLWIVGYALLAYLRELWRFLLGPGNRFWDWEAPGHLGAFGQWYFQEGALVPRMLAPTLSGVALIAGIALASLAVPLLIRRGADAIDLAVTESGAITRGALSLSWDEVAEILVIEDERVSSPLEKRPFHTPRVPQFVVNLTFTAAHSRTRVALVLRDLPEVAARSTPSQRRGLRVDHDGTHGYALCDLWVHPEHEVQASLAQLTAGAETAQIPVTELRRTRTATASQLVPRWLTALLART